MEGTDIKCPVPDEKYFIRRVNYIKKHRILGASIGNCVHVAGVVHFLNLAGDEGYETDFLGPAISVSRIIEHASKSCPDIIALGYRLTPANVIPLIEELKLKSGDLGYKPVWIFGGTRPVAAEVERLCFFDKIFDSTEDIDDCIAFLRNETKGIKVEIHASDLVSRISQKQPYPLLRHHFGLPSFDDTLKGIEKIANSKVLDVISLGIDQSTQQYFFHPEKRQACMDGAGGVPVRSPKEFSMLKLASECGNYPLMRCYSGTADVLALAGVLRSNIQNAWCAVPLCWYNELDGRGDRKLKPSITEAQLLMRWHAERNIPVELNEPHHWGLRDAHDTISVAMSFISAYNAKKAGIRHYISQYMFNIPNSLSFSMDLAKVLAQIEVTESLADETFTTYRQVRTGLPFLSGDSDIAKGQLAASTALQMTVKPHIIHVVGFSEGEFAATPEVVIESCKIVRGVVRSVLQGNADSTEDRNVIERKAELLEEAKYLLGYIVRSYEGISGDPLADPGVLTDCIHRGILDAPHIVKNDEFCGKLQTRVIKGKCVAYDVKKRIILNEKERLKNLKEAQLIESK
ncbi:MAG: methionine synthase [Eubacteriales bacterium]|nr:methionine synthase [Eubacteriales bacterium]